LGIIAGADCAAPVIAHGIPDREAGAIKKWLSVPAQSTDGHATELPCSDPPHWVLSAATPVAGVAGRHCVAQLDRGSEVAGYADLYRAPDAPDFDAATAGAFLSLVPQLAQALALAVRVATAEAGVRRCAQCQDMLPFGCMVLGADGSVLEMNSVAGEMLASGDGLALVDSRLRALRTADDEALHAFLGDAPVDVSRDGAAFASLPRPSGHRRYVLFNAHIVVQASAFARRPPRQRIVIVDPETSRSVPREVLRTLYEFTETESWVAWHLAGGESLEEVARRLGIAHNTARHHLERIFAKTGTHRQSDLVRLIDAPFVSLGGKA
jgi:DNA-binding CsgD family transcriptional regulator